MQEILGGLGAVPGNSVMQFISPTLPCERPGDSGRIVMADSLS
jgi:hypothetical protein